MMNTSLQLLLIAEHTGGQQTLHGTDGTGTPPDTVPDLATTLAADWLASHIAKPDLFIPPGADDSAALPLLPEQLAPLIAARAADYDIIAGLAGYRMRALLPRLAALTGRPVVPDIINLTPEGHYQRPLRSGQWLETLARPARPHLITLDPAMVMTPSAERQARTATATPESVINHILTAADAPIWLHSRVLAHRPPDHDNRMDLARAKIVIGGGRGMKSAGAFERLFKLASRLGAAVGGSRAAVDHGWIDNALQIGETGKTIAPALYLALGISGAPQHLVGIYGAQLIVAVNNDPEAPLVRHAVYALIMDVSDFLDQLETMLPE